MTLEVSAIGKFYRSVPNRLQVCLLQIKLCCWQT